MSTNTPIPFNMSLRVMSDIQEERNRQDEKWGGPDHDDQHCGWEWIYMIQTHAREAGKMIRHLPQEDKMTEAMQLYRKEMVRTAALAVAALEAIDRAVPDLRRSYDPNS